MISVEMEDVLAVLQLCKPYIIGIIAVLVIGIVIMIACRRMSRGKKFLIRGEAVIAMVLAVVVCVNMICFGPMATLIGLATGNGTLSDETNEEAAEAAEEIMEDGIVLLKNESLLPLNETKKLNIFGWESINPAYGGAGSGGINDLYDIVSLNQGLENAGFSINQELVDFYNNYGADNPEMSIQKQSWTLPEPPVDTYSDELIKGAKEYSDVAVVVLSRKAGEGHNDIPMDVRKAAYDNNSDEYDDFPEGEHYLQLSQTERDMVDMVCSNFDNVIVIYNGANQFELGFADEYPQIKSVVWCPGTGNVGFNALGKVFSGEVNPSGKTPDTFIYDMTTAPWWNNGEKIEYTNLVDMAVEGMNAGSPQVYAPAFTNYVEGIYVGYKYYETAAQEGFIDYDKTVQYPFGYGLSYTEFEQKMGELEEKDGQISVDVEVTNTGDVAGKDVVEVYYNPPYTNGGIEKASANLIEFAKTDLLQPGDSQTVTVTFDVEDMASYDSYDAAWVMEEGEYTIRVGNSSRTTEVAAIIDLDETVQTVLLKNVMKDKEFVKEIHHMVPIFDLELDDTPFMRPILIYAENFKKKIMEYEVIRTTLEDKRPDEILTLEDVKKGAASLEELVAQLTVEEMADLCVGTERLEEGGNVIGSSSACVPGAAGDTTSALIEKRKIPNLILADGPAGLRLQTHFKTDKEGNKLPGGEQFGMEIAPFAKEQPEGAQDYYQYCTAIPIATTLAQSWDVDLIKRMGEIVGEEMEQFHIHLWLAPGMNIHRNPLCGRNFEYYSEDPYVAGTIAAAMTEGVQSNYGCGTTIKHFACNNQEDNRMGSDSVVSERTLRELYLKGFEIAVKESQPMSIMTSYNLINGVHAANNYDLCTDAARNEWGFKGMIMTDWTTTEIDEKCTASGCMRAGNDLVMPGCFGDHDNMRKALAEGTLKIEDLKACIARLVSVIWKSNQYLQ